MKPAKSRILTINGGASSIKFALFEAGDSLLRILEGGVERFGLPEATLRVKGLNQADNFSRLLTAVHHGKSGDTSMSFPPTARVPMNTRLGNLDPGLFWYLAHTEGLDAKRFNEMVNFHSGQLGMSETSSDMHDLLAREASDLRAVEAVALFSY
jgi:acetate kinase